MLRWKLLSDFGIATVAELLALPITVGSICLTMQPAVRRTSDSHCLELSFFLNRICNIQTKHTPYW
jgi:hypothetical protein